jgi:membrane protein CcdC involved in cytochrome C biogenesis
MREDQRIGKVLAISKAVLHFLMIDPRASAVQVCDVMALGLLFSCLFPLLARQEQTTSTKTYARPEQPLVQ